MEDAELSPPKVHRIEDDPMGNIEEEATIQAGGKRRGSLATSSSGISSMGMGVRTSAQEEVQGMVAAQVLAPIVSELQE